MDTRIRPSIELQTVLEVMRFYHDTIPDRTAFTFLGDGERDTDMRSFAELYAGTCGLARILTAEGRQGQRALLLYPSGLEFVDAFLACLASGIVAVPAYPPEPGRLDRSLSRLEAIAEDADVSLVLTTQETLTGLEAHRRRFPSLDRAHWRVTDALFGAGTPPVSSVPLPSGDDTGKAPAYLQYTSGSTGRPRGVMVTQANLLHNSRMISHAFGHDHGLTMVGWLPLFHDMGLVATILHPLLLGGHGVIMPPQAFLERPMRWLEAISRYRAHTSGGPDFAYGLCARRMERDRLEALDLSCWRTAFNGAEPVRAHTIEQFTAAFAPAGFRLEAFLPCYGLAEATLLVASPARGRAPLHLEIDRPVLERGRLSPRVGDDFVVRTSCGEPAPGQRIAIVDPESSRRCAPGEVGEIWVSGPNVAAGYWARADESATTFQARLEGDGGHWLRTGDLGALVDGQLYIVSRLKDLLIVRGRNLAPQDLEQTIEASHPRLRPGGAAAFPLEVNGEELPAVVAEVRSDRGATTGATTLDDEIITAIRGTVADAFGCALAAVALIPAGRLPKTSSGKVQRSACRKALEAGTLATVAVWWDVRPPQTTRSSFSSPAQDPLVEILARGVGLEPAQLDRALSLSSQGLDSLKAMELRDSLEVHLARPVALEALWEPCSTDGLLSMLRRSDAQSSPPSTQAHRVPSRSPLSCAPGELEGLQARIDQHIARFAGGNLFHGPAPTPGSIRLNSNDYLALSGDPRIRRARQRALEASDHDVFMSSVFLDRASEQARFEQAMARFLGAEDAVLCQSGWSANDGLIAVLSGGECPVYLDLRAHMSFWQGARSARATVYPFRHHDAEHLRALARQHGPGVVALEAVYSTHGDQCPLEAFADVAAETGCVLVVDESHSVGIFGPAGAGLCAARGLLERVHYRTLSLSKAFVNRGGLVAGPARVLEYYRFASHPTIFSSALVSHEIAGLEATLEVIQAEAGRRERVLEISTHLRDALCSLGYPVQMSQAPILALEAGSEARTLELRQLLEARGVIGSVFCEPATPRDGALIRLSISSGLSNAEVEWVIEACADVRERVNPKAWRSWGGSWGP